MPPSAGELRQRVTSEATEIFLLTKKNLGGPEPTREELAERFEQILASDSIPELQALRAEFEHDFGNDAYSREWELKLQRERTNDGV